MKYPFSEINSQILQYRHFYGCPYDYNRAASQIAQKPFSCSSEHIMMDKFKSVKNVDNKMSFIYADAVTHRIVNIVPDRWLSSLKDYFLCYP